MTVTIKVVLQIMFVMVLWAICFPLITVGITWAPHLSFAALRAFIAGAALLVLALVLRRPLPRGRRVWGLLMLAGLGATSLGFLGMFHAAEFLSPGIATVIANTQPLMAAVLAQMFLSERLGIHGKTGLAIGFVGILLITLPQLTSGIAGNFPLGFAYIVLTALGVSVSNVVLKRLAGEVDALMAVGIQLVLGGIPLAVAAFAFEQPSEVTWSLEFIWILLSLSLFGSALVYWLWFSVLEKIELNRANAFSFLVPVLGLMIAAAFFGERIGWMALAGIALTILGVGLVNRNTFTKSGKSGPQQISAPGPFVD
jgi:drug/metabolite transporter (DMT)-like permease